MAVVAYLLGAGASAQCIPVVDGMAGGIDKLLKDLNPITANYGNSLYGEHRTSFKNKFDYCKGILNKLKNVCIEYYSIDTYAKRLYLTDPIRFNELKRELCFYFTLVQVLQPKDKRYDNFFASIINEIGTLPPRIKILSWNYDFQLELSHSQFVQDKSLPVNRGLLNMISPANFKGFNTGKFNVVKLNGSASFKDKNGFFYLHNHDITDFAEKVIKVITDFYDLNRSDTESDLNFAWENTNFEDMINVLDDELKSIETLVVIGYSFPYFNRKIDGILFDRMKNLKKIYIQDIYPDDIKEILEEFVELASPAIKGITFVGKTNVKQFVFPKELEVG